jgi:HSP20 family protein
MSRVCMPSKVVELLWNDESFYREVEGNKKVTISKFPKYDQWCDDKYLNMTFALAGYSKDDIDLEITGNKLILRNINNMKNPDDKSLQQGFIIRGIARRDFKLGFELSSEFDLDKAEANMKNGLLNIKVPKGEPSVSKKLTIRGE